MNDQTELLGQLKIDRGSDTGTSSGWGPWLGIGLILIVVLGIAAAWLTQSNDVAVIRTAVARSLAGTAGSPSASVLDASGYVEARRQATVSSKVTGKVLQLLIEEGQRVQQGDVLARLDDSNAQAQVALATAQLAAARASLDEIKVRLDDARRQLRRAQELAAQKLVSQAELDTAQANADSLAAQLTSARSNVTVAQKSLAVQQQQLDDTVVRAPFAGVITVKNAQEGEMISPLSAGGDGTRTGIGTLVDMDSLEIEVDVNENFINRVLPQQPVTAKLNAYPDWEIPARVIAVIPTADRSKATVKVRIGFDESDPRILPDMGVRVSFLEEAAPAAAEQPVTKAVLVPASAVQNSGSGDVVYVVKGGKLDQRSVTVNKLGASGAQISKGLRAGEIVAVGNLGALRDGLAVEVEE